MLFLIRRQTLDFAGQNLVAFPEVRVGECYRKAVVAVRYINQTIRQTVA